MPLILSIDNLSVVKTWVDASFAVHNNMRSHTGGVIMMGKGSLYASSKRQKLNTKSSTEAELVGAGDFLPQTIWTNHFLEAQGYKVKESDFHQDNESAMRLEKNGRASAGQRSRHINIRFFFIKDRVASGEINLIYCPTEDMIADYFTKPLQGAVFRRFRDIVMGVTHPDSHVAEAPDGQERVENCEKGTHFEAPDTIDSNGDDSSMESCPKNTLLKKVTWRDVVVNGTKLSW